MKWGYHHRKQLLGGLVLGLFMVTGTYNAVVINSESYISGSDVKLVKRLDEVYGVVKPGRLVASNLKWKKLSPVEVQQVNKLQIAKTVEAASSIVPSMPVIEDNTSTQPQVVAQAAVQEELDLKLIEVTNPKKWAKGLTQGQFYGTINTRDGIIEELSVSLPDDLGVSVSFSELTGNVFNYEADGESYSGMMYQVDQNSYKVNITSGPLEGTIMTFAGEPSVEQLAQQEQHEMQQEHNRQEVAMSIENSGQETPAPESQEQPMPEETAYGSFASDPNISEEAQQAFAQDQAATQAAMMQAQGLDQNQYQQQELPQDQQYPQEASVNPEQAVY